MNKMYQEIVDYLRETKRTISTMESCSGGSIVNAITNISGASDVISFSAVTYSNEAKIKFGVNKMLIDKYTVYSKEVAKNMAKVINDYTSSTYSIGVTGKLNRQDENNPYGKNNEVFICIYDSLNNKYYNKKVEVLSNNRIDNKNMILDVIAKELLGIIKK